MLLLRPHPFIDCFKNFIPFTFPQLTTHSTSISNYGLGSLFSSLICLSLRAFYLANAYLPKGEERESRGASNCQNLLLPYYDLFLRNFSFSTKLFFLRDIRALKLLLSYLVFGYEASFTPPVYFPSPPSSYPTVYSLPHQSPPPPSSSPLLPRHCVHFPQLPSPPSI